MKPTQHYLRQARRKSGDPQVIFETAAPDLTPRDLARVVEALRSNPRHWRLPKGQRDALIRALLDAGETQEWTAETLGVASRTVRRTATENAPPKHRLNKPSNPDRNGDQVLGHRKADSGLRTPLSFDASGTDWADHCRILRLLGEGRV